MGCGKMNHRNRDVQYSCFTLPQFCDDRASAILNIEAGRIQYHYRINQEYNLGADGENRFIPSPPYSQADLVEVKLYYFLRIQFCERLALELAPGLIDYICFWLDSDSISCLIECIESEFHWVNHEFEISEFSVGLNRRELLKHVNTLQFIIISLEAAIQAVAISIIENESTDSFLSSVLESSEFSVVLSEYIPDFELKYCVGYMLGNGAKHFEKPRHFWLAPDSAHLPECRSAHCG